MPAESWGDWRRHDTADTPHSVIGDTVAGAIRYTDGVTSASFVKEHKKSSIGWSKSGEQRISSPAIVLFVLNKGAAPRHIVKYDYVHRYFLLQFDYERMQFLDIIVGMYHNCGQL